MYPRDGGEATSDAGVMHLLKAWCKASALKGSVLAQAALYHTMSFNMLVVTLAAWSYGFGIYFFPIYVHLQKIFEAGEQKSAELRFSAVAGE